MSTRFIYAQESPRAWARAIAPTLVLRERGVAVAAQLQTTLDLRTSYDMTVLTDWTPDGEALNRFEKPVYWDLPEDILQHVEDERYRALFAQVQGVITHSPHVAQTVKGLTHRAIVLPTLLPDIHLRTMSGIEKDHVIGMFGLVVIENYKSTLQQILDKRAMGLFTTETILAEQIRPAMHVINQFVPYVQLLRRCPIVFSPQTANSGADPMWIRNALFLGIPTIVAGAWEGLTDHPGIKHATASTLAETIQDVSNTTWAPIMSAARQQLLLQYGVRFHVHTWQTMLEKEARRFR